MGEEHGKEIDSTVAIWGYALNLVRGHALNAVITYLDFLSIDSLEIPGQIINRCKHHDCAARGTRMRHSPTADKVESANPNKEGRGGMGRSILLVHPL